MICLKRMEFIIMMSFFSIKDVRTLYHLKSMLKSRKVYGGCPDTETTPCERTSAKNSLKGLWSKSGSTVCFGSVRCTSLKVLKLKKIIQDLN